MHSIDLNVRASQTLVLLLIGAAALSTCQIAEEQANEQLKKQSGSWLHGFLPSHSNKTKPMLTNELDSRVKDICYYNHKVPVQRISEMRALIAAINLDQYKHCKSRYMSAIYELDPILKLDDDTMCQDHAFQLIKDYHFRFIQPFKRTNRRPTQFEPMPNKLVKEQLHPEPRKYTVEFDEHDQVLLAPIAIRHFFLKFILQVSYVCKKNLINNLQADSERLLTENDHDVMEMFGRESPIGQALGDNIKEMDFDSVLHIPELDGKLVSSSGETVLAGREQYLKTSASENSALFQMIYTCKKRLKPLYDRLIMPIVRLSKLGYDYRGELGFTERERRYLEGARMKNWLVVMHVCEIFKNTHLLRDDNTELTGPQVETSEEEGKLVPISEEEAHKLELERPDVEKETFAKFVPINYELTVRNIISDQLMIESERQLDIELARKHGNLGFTGFRRLLAQASDYLKRTLAKLDLERFAHYRHNSLFYSGLLNFLSACSNVASISLTISSMVG